MFKSVNKGLPWWFSGQDCAPNSGGPGSIPGWGTKSHMHAATKKKERKKINPGS